MVSTGLLAQPATNTPTAAPPAPTPAPQAAGGAAAATAITNAPAEKKMAAQKKSAPKKKDAAAELKTVPLVAGPARVVATHVNVRGQAKLNSEVIGRLTNGQPVTVIQEIVRNNSATNEPSAWAKIVLPETAHAWVNSSYINSSNKTVIPKKLKLRGGPGENFSVLGIITRGETVKEVSTKGDWTEIEAPAEGYAFVAAQYLKQEPARQVAVATPEPAPVPTPVAEPTPVAAAPTETSAVPAVPTEPIASTGATNPPAAEEPPPKRIVQREGIVHGTLSIQAPTSFELVSPDSGRAIDYLYTTSRELDLRRYKGLRIIVTGEESLDARWKNTPVITIESIHVIE
jgi:uncharacterized protein YgiM (DUF1202 family)